MKLELGIIAKIHYINPTVIQTLTIIKEPNNENKKYLLLLSASLQALKRILAFIESWLNDFPTDEEHSEVSLVKSISST